MGYFNIQHQAIEDKKVENIVENSFKKLKKKKNNKFYLLLL